MAASSLCSPPVSSSVSMTGTWWRPPHSPASPTSPSSSAWASPSCSLPTSSSRRYLASSWPPSTSDWASPSAWGVSAWLWSVSSPASARISFSHSRNKEWNCFLFITRTFCLNVNEADQARAVYLPPPLPRILSGNYIPSWLSSNMKLPPPPAPCQRVKKLSWLHSSHKISLMFVSLLCWRWQIQLKWLQLCDGGREGRGMTRQE